MRRSFRDLSIKHKLLAIVVATSAVSLGLASAAFVGYDVASYKRSFVRELEAQAHIIAYNSAAALTFDDYESAAETLAALRKENRVVGAYLLSPEGQVFAQYERLDMSGRFPRPRIEKDGAFYLEDRLVVREPVEFDGDIIGYVYIEADLNELHARVNGYVGLATAIVASALIIVLLLSSRLQRVISDPILHLAGTARRISREKDYGLRATKSGNDEVGALIDGFNEMLAEIQARDRELSQHRERLEEAVVRRTTELREVAERLRESEERLRTIVEGTSSTTGSEYFDALVSTLARALGTRWVLVGALDDDARTVRVQAMWDGKQVVRDISYELQATPCERAYEDSFCLYDDRVAEIFPNDRMLSDWGVRSYVGVVLRDSSGNAVGILNAFHDGPLPEAAREGSLLRVFASRAAAELERMRVEADLQESESRTRAILESAADGIVTIDDRGVIQSANRAAERIFGASAEEITGTPLPQWMRFGDGEPHYEAFRDDPAQVFAQVIGNRAEMIGIRKDASEFPVNVAVGAMRLGSGIGYTVIVRDITRERELDRMKSDFVSTVSHEIRTPLAAIISSAKILLRSGDSKPGVTAKFSSIIVEEGKRLTRLINDLLDLSKMDAGKIDWSVKEASAEELIRHVVALHEGDAQAKQIDVVVEIEEELPGIYVDRDRIVQVLTNLVSNAIKFTHERGCITLTAHRDAEGFVRIGVRDTGVGIAPEHQAEIFERFKQIGDVLTDRPQGTGLGLPICKQIIEYLGGRIWVESVVGEGATFWFTVPVADAAVAEQARNEAETPTDPHTQAGRDRVVVERNTSDERAESPAAADAEPLSGVPTSQEGAPAEDAASVVAEPVTSADAAGAVAGGNAAVRNGSDAGRPDAEHSEASAGTDTSPHETCILVVEDDASTAEILRHTLESQGFRVEVARRTEEAVRKAVEIRPVLVTLDIMLADGSGFDVLRALRAKSELATVPVVLLSVLADEERGEKALRLGANAYMTKPFETETLMATIHQLVSRGGRDALIISEEASDAESLKTTLREQGFSVVQAFDSGSGLSFARRFPPDLILLQAAASNQTAQRILADLRADGATSRIPVVLVTADAVSDRRAFYLGGWSESSRSDSASLTEILSSLVQHCVAPHEDDGASSATEEPSPDL